MSGAHFRLYLLNYPYANPTLGKGKNRCLIVLNSTVNKHPIRCIFWLEFWKAILSQFDAMHIDLRQYSCCGSATFENIYLYGTFVPQHCLVCIDLLHVAKPCPAVGSVRRGVAEWTHLPARGPGVRGGARAGVAPPRGRRALAWPYTQEERAGRTHHGGRGLCRIQNSR